MRGISFLSASFLALGTFYCDRTSGFVTPPATVVGAGACATRLWSSRCGRPSDAMSMAAEPLKAATRTDAIAAAVTGLLASVAGVSSVTAAAVPVALPSCPTEGNCVSSTSFNMVMEGKYLAPWYYGDDAADASTAFSKLVTAVENDANLKMVSKDAEGFYIVAQARSAVPPDGFDKVEFLLRPADGLVSFRSQGMKDAYAGPVIIGDGGSNRNRLEALRKRLGWPERGIDDYMADQGIDRGTVRAKGFLSELGWRQTVSQSYGEEDDDDI